MTQDNPDSLGTHYYGDTCDPPHIDPSVCSWCHRYSEYCICDTSTPENTAEQKWPTIDPLVLPIYEWNDHHRDGVGLYVVVNTPGSPGMFLWNGRRWIDLDFPENTAEPKRKCDMCSGQCDWNGVLWTCSDCGEVWYTPTPENTASLTERYPSVTTEEET